MDKKDLLQIEKTLLINYKEIRDNIKYLDIDIQEEFKKNLSDLITGIDNLIEKELNNNE